MTEIYIATEDALSESVVDRLVVEVGRNLNVAARIRKGGNQHLRAKLPSLARTATVYPVILLTDLDSAECAPSLINDWCQGLNMPERMFLRVAVREVESWLLADRSGFSRFSRIPISQIPRNPDDIDDPKRTLMTLVRRHSARDIKADILPQPRSSATVGLGYNQVLSHFVRETWSPNRASENSDSLHRMCECVRRLRE